MSYAMSAALLEAVHARLSGDAALAALVGGAVYDAPPEGALPEIYVAIGPEDVRDRSDGTGRGAWHRFVVSVVTGFLKLRLGDRGDPVFEVEACKSGTEFAHSSNLAVLIGPCQYRLVVLEVDQLIKLVLIQRLVNLDVLTIWKPDNTSSLSAVQDQLTIFSLQRKASSLGNEVSDEWTDNQKHLHCGQNVV
jgi:hypothetical protein